MISDDNKVYFQLRVAPSSGENKHSVLYNGISANDWLRPGGISAKQTPNQENIVRIETLNKRPQTANSILVIKQNNQYRGLEKYETLSGHSINFRNEIHPSVEVDFTRPSIPLQRPVTAYITRAVKKGVVLTKRPKTAYDSCRDTNLDLTIQPTRCNDKGAKQTVHRNGLKDQGSRKGRSTTNDFDTIDGIKRSFQARAQSAPACIHRINSTTSNRSKPNLYWRAKSAYHRQHAHQNGAGSTSTTENLPEQRSLLRPLLFSSEGMIKHSAGCPYKCKGCFKACLVSQDYLDKSQQNEENSWRRQRRIKRGPGFSVELALAKSQPLYQSVYSKFDADDFDKSPVVKEAWSKSAAEDVLQIETPQ